VVSLLHLHLFPITPDKKHAEIFVFIAEVTLSAIGATIIFFWGGGGGAEPTALHNLCLILKYLRANIRLGYREKLKLKRKNLHIYSFHIFQNSNVLYQSSGDSSGCCRLKNKSRKTLDIILSTIFFFALGKGGGGWLALQPGTSPTSGAPMLVAASHRVTWMRCTITSM